MTNTNNIQKNAEFLNGKILNDAFGNNDTIIINNKYFVENLGCQEAQEDDFYIYNSDTYATSFRSQDINKIKEWLDYNA